MLNYFTTFYYYMCLNKIINKVGAYPINLDIILKTIDILLLIYI